MLALYTTCHTIHTEYTIPTNFNWLALPFATMNVISHMITNNDNILYDPSGYHKP
jgi:hypothetical protein